MVQANSCMPAVSPPTTVAAESAGLRRGPVSITSFLERSLQTASIDTAVSSDRPVIVTECQSSVCTRRTDYCTSTVCQTTAVSTFSASSLSASAASQLRSA